MVIAGDGPEGPDLRALAERLELTGSPGNADPLVRFLGSRSDVPGLLRAADVLLLTSRWEGLPYAVLEAMAAGVPLVATRVGGIPELVVDGATGVVAEPGDTEGIAAALMRLLGDRALRSRLGAEAKRRSRRLFSEARMVDATAVVYRAALSRAPRRTRS